MSTIVVRIARRELLALYGTLLPWLALAGAQLVISWLTFIQLEAYQKIQPELTAAGSALGTTELVAIPTLNTLALLVLLIAPLFGLQGIAAERRSARLSLMLSAPPSPLAISLGKLLGQWLALWPLLAIGLLTVATLLLATPLDAGRLLSAVLTLGLLALLAAALSLWLSSMGTHPAAAATAAYALLLFLWLLDPTGTTGGTPDSGWSWFALGPHLKAGFAGLLRLSDVLYYGIVSAAAIALTTHRLWQLGGGR